jgi:hypothetical protein
MGILGYYEIGWEKFLPASSLSHQNLIWEEEMASSSAGENWSQYQEHHEVEQLSSWKFQLVLAWEQHPENNYWNWIMIRKNGGSGFYLRSRDSQSCPFGCWRKSLYLRWLADFVNLKITWKKENVIGVRLPELKERIVAICHGFLLLLFL